VGRENFRNMKEKQLAIRTIYEGSDREGAVGELFHNNETRHDTKQALSGEMI